MSTKKIHTATRLDNGKQATGKLFTWKKFPGTAIICEDHHERISQGHRIELCTIKQLGQ